MHLSRYPRVKLCHAPTPLEKMSDTNKKYKEQKTKENPKE